MAGGSSLTAASELAVLFVFRPVLAVAFVLSFILLSMAACPLLLFPLGGLGFLIEIVCLVNW
jgi:hypothetical protein